MVGGLTDASEVCFVSDDVRAVRDCSGQNVKGYHTQSPSVAPGAFDLGFYHPEGHAAKGQVFNWIDALFEKLRIGGSVLFAGQKDRGVLSYTRRIEAVFGQVERVGRNGRMLFFRATKRSASPGVAPYPSDQLIEAMDLPGGDFQFHTKDGVFSRDGIDAGSRILLDHISVKHDALVFDAGCGYGLLGIVGARLVPDGRVWMGDVSARAVSCARENVALNRVNNASVAVSDLFECAGDTTFDLILSNPPFHEGNKTAWPLIDGAYDKLNSGGVFMIVVMRPGPYVKRLEAVFGRVEICATLNGYTVLKSQKDI